jgi:hypothetical protein
VFNFELAYKYSHASISSDRSINLIAGLIKKHLAASVLLSHAVDAGYKG